MNKRNQQEVIRCGLALLWLTVMLALPGNFPTLVYADSSTKSSVRSNISSETQQLPPNQAPVAAHLHLSPSNLLPPEAVERIRLYKLNVYEQFKKIHPQPIPRGSEVVVDLDQHGAIISAMLVFSMKATAEENRLIDQIKKLDYRASPLPKEMIEPFAWIIFGDKEIREVTNSEPKK